MFILILNNLHRFIRPRKRPAPAPAPARVLSELDMRKRAADARFLRFAGAAAVVLVAVTAALLYSV